MFRVMSTHLRLDASDGMMCADRAASYHTFTPMSLPELRDTVTFHVQLALRVKL